MQAIVPMGPLARIVLWLINRSTAGSLLKPPWCTCCFYSPSSSSSSKKMSMTLDLRMPLNSCSLCTLCLTIALLLWNTLCFSCGQVRKGAALMRMHFQKHRHLLLPSLCRLASARQQLALHDESSLLTLLYRCWISVTGHTVDWIEGCVSYPMLKGGGPQASALGLLMGHCDSRRQCQCVKPPHHKISFTGGEW